MVVLWKWVSHHSWKIFLTSSSCSSLHEDNNEKVTIYCADAIGKHTALSFTDANFLVIALLVSSGYNVRCLIHSSWLGPNTQVCCMMAFDGVVSRLQLDLQGQVWALPFGWLVPIQRCWQISGDVVKWVMWWAKNKWLWSSPLLPTCSLQIHPFWFPSAQDHQPLLGGVRVGDSATI